MHNILIVDDEPMICKGLKNLLESSGLDINELFIAYSGQQALDYLRFEEIDLIITDIHMNNMNGIELMQQAKLVKPWVQTIIISAYETFQYAQLAIRLGAKDYLIKPINSKQFLDSVRNVLLKFNKSIPDEEMYKVNLQQHFRMEDLSSEKIKVLNRLISEPNTVGREGYNFHGIQLSGQYYAILKVMPERVFGMESLNQMDHDYKFDQYAIINIINELMEEHWSHIAFYSFDGGVNIIIQWDEEGYQDNRINKITQLELIGRAIHFNVKKYLKISCIVGISQILKGESFLRDLNEQATKALRWNLEHKDHYVFYYGDFNWKEYADEPTPEEFSAQSFSIIERVKDYIEENYKQKGLTMQEIAQQNHVSPNYLSYLFKKSTGYNLWEYVVMKRMERSKWLLLNSDLRRYEIAEAIGYESPEHFSRIFKKYFGVSPSEIKK